MERQQQKISAPLASNVCTIVSSQNKIKSNPRLLSASPTSIITVITSSSYGIASLSTQLGVSCQDGMATNGSILIKEVNL
jgi:hypothetical protein